MRLIPALGSSISAALTPVLAKIRMDRLNSTLSTAIRTFAVPVMSWGMGWAGLCARLCNAQLISLVPLRIGWFCGTAEKSFR